MKNKIGRPAGSKYNIDNYIGKTINKWTILGFSHFNSKGEQYWDTKCQCGNLSKIRVYPLIKGISKSCKHCRPQSMKGELSPWWSGICKFSISFFNGIKESAKSRGLEFSITPEYIQSLFDKQEGKCFYTNLDLTFPNHTRDFSKTASLDRIDSSIGYVENNVQWVHKSINKMKQDLKEEDFLLLCKLVASHKV
jgi:hypothetical protein